VRNQDVVRTNIQHWGFREVGCYGGTKLNWLVVARRVFVDAMSGTIKTGISRPSE
jgi:hypothetical protein